MTTLDDWRPVLAGLAYPHTHTETDTMSDRNDAPHEILFPLPRGNVIMIRLRKKVTAAEFELLKRVFELSELSFVEDEPEDRP